MTSKPVREQILDKTLGAVREKKAQRKKNQATLMGASALAAIGVILLGWQKTSQPNDRSSQKAVVDLKKNPQPMQISPNEVRIDISEGGSIQTKNISLEELAKIVYNPSLKFSRTNDTFTWKGDYKVIHMSLPQTSMAITDTRDEPL